MTSKERVKKIISHEETDRVAVDFSARPEVCSALKKYLRLKDGESPEERLGADLRGIWPCIKKSAHELFYADPTIRAEGGIYYDIWGVGFRHNRTGMGSYMDLCASPLKNLASVKQLDDYPWPGVDMWDYSGVYSQAKSNERYWVWAHSRGIFEISWFMRGFEEFMMDLMTEPELASALMDRVQKYLTERAERILREGRGGIDMIEYNDDVGAQGGLLLRPETWRKFIKPRMASFISMCRGYGARVRYHSCGGIRPIIPDLIEIGVDVLNPVQTLAAGMEPEGLKKDFGKRITFNGGVDTQRLLVNSTPGEVKTEVKRLIEILGRGGGYILAPSHVFQSDVPVENIVSVYEAAQPAIKTADKSTG